MKNTVDLDDLLNAPLVINPDDEIKENDVVITEGVVTDDDLLNAPLVIDSNTDEETNIKTDIPEEHEVKEEKEKNIPPSQDTLYSRYKEKYPQLFQNGQLVDFDAAEEIGIISPVSGVATDNEQVTGGHVSTSYRSSSCVIRTSCNTCECSGCCSCICHLFVAYEQRARRIKACCA